VEGEHLVYFPCLEGMTRTLTESKRGGKGRGGKGRGGKGRGGKGRGGKERRLHCSLDVMDREGENYTG
jgi:hypothetical protein